MQELSQKFVDAQYDAREIYFSSSQQNLL